MDYVICPKCKREINLHYFRGGNCLVCGRCELFIDLEQSDAPVILTDSSDRVIKCNHVDCSYISDGECVRRDIELDRMWSFVEGCRSGDHYDAEFTCNSTDISWKKG